MGLGRVDYGPGKPARITRKTPREQRSASHTGDVTMDMRTSVDAFATQSNRLPRGGRDNTIKTPPGTVVAEDRTRRKSRMNKGRQGPI